MGHGILLRFGYMLGFCNLLSTGYFHSCVYAVDDFCFLVMTLVNGGGFSATNCQMFAGRLWLMFFGAMIYAAMSGSFLSLDHTVVVFAGLVIPMCVFLCQSLKRYIYILGVSDAWF